MLSFNNSKLEEIKNKNNLLHSAMSENQWDIVADLLTIPEVRDSITGETSYLMVYSAIESKEATIAKSLLAIPSVRATMGSQNNFALRIAIEYGEWDLVKELFSISAVQEAGLENAWVALIEMGNAALAVELLNRADLQDTVAAKDNLMLRTAINRNEWDLVTALLKLPAVRNAEIENAHLVLLTAIEAERLIPKELLSHSSIQKNIADNAALLLQAACENGKWGVIRAFMAIQAVRDNLAVNNNLLLVTAIKNDKFKLVKNLLTIPAVREEAATQNNFVLRTAIENGQWDLTQDLLAIPSVNRLMIENVASVLELAIHNQQWEIVRNLLKLKPMQQYLVANRGFQLFKLLEKFPKSQFTLIDSLTLYGLSLTQITENLHKNKQVEALKKYAAKPITYLMQRKSPEKIIACMRIFHTTQEVMDYKQRLVRRRERFNDVNDNGRLAAIRTHYVDVIKPYLKSEFEGFGETDLDRITGIEAKIREMLFNAIREEGNAEIVQFINSLNDIEKNALFAASDKGLMARARNLFTDTTSISQTAWRGYDADAPVRDSKDWPNLLTPPATQEQIHTLPVIGLENPTLDGATQLAREMVAYSYLFVTDKNDGDDIAREVRKTAFIEKLAEIRRTHSVDTANMDDPSCLPGTVSRVGDMWIEHSKSMVPGASKLLEEELKELILEKFNESQENKENLYHSLVMLSSYNAEDIIANKIDFSDEMIAIRNRFYHSLGSTVEIYTRINDRLKKRGARALTNEELNIYVPAFLADFGGPWCVDLLTNVYTKDMQKTLENPYRQVLAMQTDILKTNLSSLLIRKLRGVERMKLSKEIPVLLLDNKTAEAMNLVKDHLREGENVESLLAEINKTLSSPQTIAQKIALWDILYEKLEKDPKDENGETIQSIVNALTEGETLENALRARQLNVDKKVVDDLQSRLAEHLLEKTPNVLFGFNAQVSTLEQQPPQKEAARLPGI